MNKSNLITGIIMVAVAPVFLGTAGAILVVDSSARELDKKEGLTVLKSYRSTVVDDIIVLASSGACLAATGVCIKKAITSFKHLK